MSVLAGGRVVTPETVLDPGWIEVRGDQIVAVGSGLPPSGASADLGGAWVLPGFVDMHVHGGGGNDMANSAGQMAAAVQFHREHGTTSTLVSLVTAPATQLREQLGWVATLARSSRGLLGAHLEGPFLAVSRCGAQNPDFLLEPNLKTFAELNTAARGTLRIITIAPELPGAIGLIRAARDADVLVALGHTDATYAQAMSAAGAGAGVATHLFNGMRPLHHREPGVVGAALDAGLAYELVNDGNHVHPAVVRLVASAHPGLLVLVTDATAAAGVPDGTTVLGGQPVDIDRGVARLRRTGALAGSTLTMGEAVRRSVVDVGLDITVAAAAAATTPARLLGVADRLGAIRPGLAADLVVLDDDFRLQQVILGGR
jgi:N-acetylglucosamine-6-phosphate deacetylase